MRRSYLRPGAGTCWGERARLGPRVWRAGRRGRWRWRWRWRCVEDGHRLRSSAESIEDGSFFLLSPSFFFPLPSCTSIRCRMCSAIVFSRSCSSVCRVCESFAAVNISALTDASSRDCWTTCAAACSSDLAVGARHRCCSWRRLSCIFAESACSELGPASEAPAVRLRPRAAICDDAPSSPPSPPPSSFQWVLCDATSRMYARPSAVRNSRRPLAVSTSVLEAPHLELPCAYRRPSLVCSTAGSCIARPGK